MESTSIFFDWLTYNWLINNMSTIVVVMLLSVSMLLIFPIFLGFDIKKETKKKNFNKKEIDN